MSHLSLSVLGDFQILKDDVPIRSFESDKVRALLAYLAVEANRPHKRDTLIGLLWPDYPEQAARHSLRQALFNLRLALGDHTASPPYLLISRDAIQFNTESDYSLDLSQFDSLYPWKRNQGWVGGGSAGVIGQLEEMANLYHGEFLQHFYLEDSAEFEEWILAQRERVHQQMMHALTCLADEYERCGEYQLARGYASRQLELDPWREEAHSQMMRLLALDGQRSAALAHYETCRKVLADELGVEPSPQTLELYERIRLGSLTSTPAVPSDTAQSVIQPLPVPLTPFFGRDQELAEIARLVAKPECRCITLVGPGGIGKTRLALQIAEQHQIAFTHGAAFVQLVSTASVEAVIPAIARSIGFALSGSVDPKIQLLHYLQTKHMLLVLDNLEHLLTDGPLDGTIGELVIEILETASEIKLMTTSREALNVQGEWSFEVQGLDYPGQEHIDGVDHYSAVALFFQRAQQARPGFVVNDDEKQAGVRLCQLVEGMPLAIELAATWIRVLSASEVVAEIERGLDFLNASMRDLPERHRSMRAVFDHSWQTLSADEQRVLGRLSVFRGGFQRQAAEQVAGASLTILSSLVIRSLVRRTSAGRYDLHELVRQYAASKLAEDLDDLQSVQERHSAYYLSRLEEQDRGLRGKHQKDFATELTAEIDNLRAAWEWAIANRSYVLVYRVSFTLCYLFSMFSWLKEGENTFRRSAQSLRQSLPGDRPDRVEQETAFHAMMAHCAYFTFRQGRSEEAYKILGPSVTYLQACPDPSGAMYALWYCGVVCWELGKFSESSENDRACVQLAQQYGDRWWQAISTEFLGVVAHDQGDYSQAHVYLNEALASFREAEDPFMIAHALSYLSRTLRALSAYDEAERMLHEGLSVSRAMNYRLGVALSLDALALVRYAQRHYEEAQKLFMESAGLFHEMGDSYRLSKTLNHQGLNAIALNQTAEAYDAFTTALRMALAGGLLPTVLYSLVGLVVLNTQQKASQERLELVIYILQHPASAQETKDLAAKLQDEIEVKLSKEEIEAAQQSAVSKSLDEVVHQALSESNEVG